MQSAAQAYGKVAKQTASGRDLEADLLLSAASRLQSIHDSWESKKTGLEEALLYNRKLWTIFLTAVTEPSNPLPAAVRQNIGNLGIFVMKQTLSISADPKPERLNPLININRQLAAGLRGQAA